MFFLPLLRPILTAGYSAQIWRLFALRSAIHMVAVLLWFYAMARLPLAELSAISFLNPVLVLVLGGLLLGERLGLRRVAVVICALLGAMLVLRPGLRELSLGHLAQLAATSSFALAYLVAQRLSSQVSAGAVVAMMTFTVPLGLAPLALWDWQPVSLSQLGLLALAAVLGSLGHYAMSKAFMAAPLAVTQPVVFLQIIWASLLGLIAFGEAIDPFVILGGGLIIGALCVNLRAEARDAKAAAVSRSSVLPAP